MSLILAQRQKPFILHLAQVQANLARLLNGAPATTNGPSLDEIVADYDDEDRAE